MSVPSYPSRERNEKPPYVVREVPAHLRTKRPVHRLIKGKDGVFHIEAEKKEPTEPQYDVFMRSMTSVRMTKTEFEKFEEQSNPTRDAEQELLNVFVGSEYAPTEGS
jgi:hypothetical protein